ncbi:uncharacterized protein LOC112085339 [Eutrema salsugineum]|uniref:uncharacterized protein LOC112085339 n=1 Tax=Eutrema salsugineum TaxID=72664 RepID=UPI000CED02EB|nr:uncharacterized protein LOC112085339 [Eutrema salsugineum]
MQNQGQHNFQNQNSSNLATQESKLELMMQQVMINQQTTAKEIHVKVDGMYHDLSNKIENIDNKYESLATHVKKLDIQVAQIPDAIKRQSGNLPGKPEINPREHCNTVMVYDKMVTTPELMDEERAHDVVVEEECTPVTPQVYVPKVPYPKTPKHLRNSITAEKLSDFEKMVRRIPHEMSSEEAWENRPLARSTPPPLKKLNKIEDPGKFAVPCSISGVEFKESLVDSGSSVNLMSKLVAERLGIVDTCIRHLQMTLAFANSSTTTSYDTIPDLLFKIGDGLVPTDFQVVEMIEGSEMPLILGRPFMATVGAIIDMPSKRISFSNIDKKVFYKAIPTKCLLH